MAGLPGEGGASRFCRYCRAPLADTARFCDVCGMASYGAGDLPRGDGDGEEPEKVMCRSCGTPITGSRCPACGARRPGAAL